MCVKVEAYIFNPVQFISAPVCFTLMGTVVLVECEGVESIQFVVVVFSFE